jgi:hypothetical protein
MNIYLFIEAHTVLRITLAGGPAAVISLVQCRGL